MGSSSASAGGEKRVKLLLASPIIGIAAGGLAIVGARGLTLA
jgi:hypothetical protein